MGEQPREYEPKDDKDWGDRFKQLLAKYTGDEDITKIINWALSRFDVEVKAGKLAPDDLEKEMKEEMDAVWKTRAEKITKKLRKQYEAVSTKENAIAYLKDVIKTYKDARINAAAETKIVTEATKALEEFASQPTEGLKPYFMDNWKTILDRFYDPNVGTMAALGEGPLAVAAAGVVAKGKEAIAAVASVAPANAPPATAEPLPAAAPAAAAGRPAAAPAPAPTAAPAASSTAPAAAAPEKPKSTIESKWTEGTEATNDKYAKNTKLKVADAVTSRLRVRNDQDGSVIGHLKKGDEVTITGDKAKTVAGETFAKISCTPTGAKKAIEGWVSIKYLTEPAKVPEAPAPTPMVEMEIPDITLPSKKLPPINPGQLRVVQNDFVAPDDKQISKGTIVLSIALPDAINRRTVVLEDGTLIQCAESNIQSLRADDARIPTLLKKYASLQESSFDRLAALEAQQALTDKGTTLSGQASADVTINNPTDVFVLSQSGKIVATPIKITPNTQLAILGKIQDYYQIVTPDGHIGYIKQSLLNNTVIAKRDKPAPAAA